MPRAGVLSCWVSTGVSMGARAASPTFHQRYGRPGAAGQTKGAVAACCDGAQIIKNPSIIWWACGCRAAARTQKHRRRNHGVASCLLGRDTGNCHRAQVYQWPAASPVSTVPGQLSEVFPIVKTRPVGLQRTVGALAARCFRSPTVARYCGHSLSAVSVPSWRRAVPIKCYARVYTLYSVTSC